VALDRPERLTPEASAWDGVDELTFPAPCGSLAAQRWAPMREVKHSSDVVQFGTFQADFRTGELRRQGFQIRLQDKPLQLLATLVERPGTLVTRDELRQRLWGDQTFVDFERSLNIAIAKLRAALGDSAHSPRFIETLPRRGYRFIAPVTVGAAHAGIPDVGQTAATQGRPLEAVAQTPVAVSELDEGPAKQLATRRAARRPMLIGALTLASLAAIVFVVFSIGEQRAARGPRRVESLAVLPLENLSGDPDQEYLADGITDALITELGKIDTVRVISRTSILPYKGARKSLPDIGRELGVDAVVEGSVVRSGNRIRITAQLLEAASDRHLWAQAFERDVHDVAALYADAAEAIGREIHANINRTATASIRPRVDPEAWASYVRGRYLWERQGANDLKKARDYFRQAIARQPDYALAYAGLADAYLLLANNRVLSPAEAVPQAKEAALKALELDASLAEAYTSLAGIACTFEADWTGAERAYKRAFDINPNYAIAHQWRGSTLAGLGRHAEAAAEMQRALELNPVSLRVGQSAGRALFLARRYTEAVERYKKTLELDPNFVPALIGLGRVYIALGRREQALAELERAAAISDRAPSSLGSLGLAYGVFGDRHRALKILAELRDVSAHAYVSPLDFADAHLGLRDNDQVFEELHRAAEHQLSSLPALSTAAEYDPLRTDPRFADLLRLVNLN
jgi:TolB-like protein/DNA-binding winged helix-turn-helix (wHTH) protein/Tfp pilus assembly protein PilF